MRSGGGRGGAGMRSGGGMRGGGPGRGGTRGSSRAGGRGRAGRPRTRGGAASCPPRPSRTGSGIQPRGDPKSIDDGDDAPSAEGTAGGEADAAAIFDSQKTGQIWPGEEIPELK